MPKLHRNYVAVVVFSGILIVGWTYLVGLYRLKYINRAISSSAKNNKDIDLPYFEDLMVWLDNATSPKPKVVEACQNSKGKDEIRIFYNRIPKAGSRVLYYAISGLFRKKKYAVVENWVKMPFIAQFFTVGKVEPFINAFMKHKAPLLFEKHQYFIDFTKYGCPQPIYINMMRDPFDRLVSQYYYLRQLKTISHEGYDIIMTNERINMTFDECVERLHWDCVRPDMTHLQVRYFCGQDPICAYPSPASLARAIYNIKTHYLVVGHMDRVKDLVTTLERKLPTVLEGLGTNFDNVDNSNKKRFSGKTKSKTASPKPEIRQKLRIFLRYEYKLYNFVKDNFDKQYRTIVGDTQ